MSITRLVNLLSRGCRLLSSQLQKTDGSTAANLPMSFHFTDDKIIPWRHMCKFPVVDHYPGMCNNPSCNSKVNQIKRLQVIKGYLHAVQLPHAADIPLGISFIPVLVNFVSIIVR